MNTERIRAQSAILAELVSLVTIFPDLRVGQIIVGAALQAGLGYDVFNATDEALAKALEDYSYKLFAETHHGREAPSAEAARAKAGPVS